MKNKKRGKTGRPAIGGSLDNQTRFPVTFNNDLVYELDRAAGRSAENPYGRTLNSRAGLIRRAVAAVLMQYRSVVLGEPEVVGRAHPCPCCLGYVDGPHADACGYFGDRSDEACSIDNLHKRLSALAARFSMHPVEPALSVAAALELLRDNRDSIAARDTLKREADRLNRHIADALRES